MKFTQRSVESATINTKFAFLRRVFRLALQHHPQLVKRVPSIKMRPVDNIRTGTLSHHQYWGMGVKAARIELPVKITKNKSARYIPDLRRHARRDRMAIAAHRKCPFFIQRGGKSVFDWESREESVQLLPASTTVGFGSATHGVDEHD